MIKKIKRNIVTGTLHVHATKNNTIVTLSDLNGNTVAWQSSGTVNFKGSRKSTPFAAQVAAETVTEKAREDYGLKRVEVVIKGAGPGREPSIRAVHKQGIRIVSIKDVTFIPYNGCRPPKHRRV